MIRSFVNKVTKIFPDKLFICIQYFYHFRKWPNISNPNTFNEKLQWLKLNDRNDAYIEMVDKIEAKNYVGNLIGFQHIIPTIKVWDKAQEITYDQLPDQFVMKCNHDSKSVLICSDKSAFELEKAKEYFKTKLKRNAYWYGREWPYKSVRPKVFIEKYMTDEVDTKDFTDYKFFCFDGYVDCVMISTERLSGNTKFYFFDRKWNLKRLNKLGKEAPDNFTIPKPVRMDEMFEIASQLSKGIPFLRVDLYQSNGQIYFGELTLYPASGYDANLLPETDKYFGDLIKIK